VGVTKLDGQTTHAMVTFVAIADASNDAAPKVGLINALDVD